MKRLVIAGVQSGSGKTTVATGIMAAFAERERVQPFKVGPDYIDPSYHTRVCGRVSRNLDTWMAEPSAVLQCFRRACRGADIAVVEGVMGLFDGRTGEGEAGSTAQVARLLRAPVVLVLDAAKIARSAAAVVLGFHAFDPELVIAGVILNRIGSPRHYEAVAGPIEQEAGVPVLGYLPRDDALALPERYLGLVPVAERSISREYVERLRAACTQTIDLARLERVAAVSGEEPGRERGLPARLSDAPPGRDGRHEGGADRSPRSQEGGLFPDTDREPSVRIAVARDEAFSFYYEDNLDLLRAWGAEIVEFSPLTDTGLPEGARGVYLGGGFPELYAAEVSANTNICSALRSAASAGMPLYAECGGLMYLAEQLTDAEGREHAMASLIPLRTSMQGRRLTLGYRRLTSRRESPLLAIGESVRAHEFHWSVLETPPGPEHAAYAVDSGERLEGYCRGSVLASYMHLHFAARPSIAPRFVETCRRWQRRASAHPEPLPLQITRLFK